MKKLIVLVILFSMMAHCASRIGFISYLYQQRHEIAYGIGLIAEIPIAMCSSDYEPDKGVHIQEQEDGNFVPPQINSAREINLFFETIEANFIPKLILLADINPSVPADRTYTSPPPAIFHPPS